ncbi:MAG TPA: hypothetical protein VGO11_18550 [Chthoniobacteraceae bacterium]|jgi:CheY-like chemotaxis protein|nr:hypothetical protein [Chthoniobacteraceae bacterium]
MSAAAPVSKPLKNVWVIDDDRIYRDVLCGGLNASLADIHIRRISTERQALEQMEKVEGGDTAPDLVIADVMMPYIFPGEEGEVPLEITELGDDFFREAGVRLWKKARHSTSSALRSVPWIYHSVLRATSMDFEKNSDHKTEYVSKDQAFKALMEAIRTEFGDIDVRWDEPDETESNLLQHPKMKARLLEAMNTPLEQCLASLE